MDDLEQQQRNAVVKEAKTWLKTPYHWQGRVKGVGVDCGLLILEVFERCGLIDHADVPHYSNEWHLHHGEEKYLRWVERYCHDVTGREPSPGDIILYQYGRCISHGAIVINYPTIIHSFLNYGGVVYGDAEQDVLKKRMKAVYSYW